MIAIGTAFVATMLWQSPWMLPAAIATATAVLSAVVLLYLPQMQEVPRGWKWVMPLLRMSAVVVLAFSMAQPTVLRPRTARQQGAIAILVDRSASMSVSDRGRSTAELVSLAGGLGTLPAGARQESAPGLRAELEAIRAKLEQVDRERGEADYAKLSGRGLPAAQARWKDAVDALREAMASLTIPARTAGSALRESVAQLKQPSPLLNDAGTRAVRVKLDAALRALSADQAQMDEKLFEDDAAVRTACIRTGRLSREALAELGLTKPGSGLLFNLPAGAPVIPYSFAAEVKPVVSPLSGGFRAQSLGSESDVTGSIREVMRELRSHDVQAVVLLSDGRQVGGESPVNGDLSALRAPVFAVAAAPPGQRKDVSIVRLEIPASARAGQTVNVRVDLRELHTAGMTPGEPIDVQLEVDRARQIRRVTIGDDWTASAEFMVTLSHPGSAAVSAMALPLAGETSDQNNRAVRWVKVSADPLRVMVIAGADVGRQFAVLHEVLSRAPWVTLREVQEENISRLSPATLASQHVVILCDVPADALSAQQWDALDEMVRERAGSVVLCAGAHLPGGYASNASSADWLPYEAADKPSWQTWPGGEPHFRLTPDRGDDAELAAAWGELAPISRLTPMRKLRGDVTPLLIDRGSGAAVITQASRGSGKVVFIGTNETWRWHPSGGSGQRDLFWPELLRHVAPEPYAAVEANVSLDVSDIAPRPEEAVNVRARLLSSDGAPVDGPAQTAWLLKDAEPISSVTLRNTGDGRYKGKLDGLAAGDYTLRLDAPPDPTAEIPPAPAIVPLHVAENLEAEMADLSGDDRLLRRMAESSGGRFVQLDQLNTLPRLLAENQEKQNQLIEYTLWDSPYLFVFVLACLSAEWALRKKFGLA